MFKPIFVFTLMCAILQAQDITVSKDSIRVYNNPIMSMADWVLFYKHANTAINLDSAYLHIDEMDTTGQGLPSLQLSWKSNRPFTARQFVWGLKPLAGNDFRLEKAVFYPSADQPLAFSLSDTINEIFMLEIGFCFQCELFPKYVSLFGGNLKLFFSNGQTVALRLFSYDMRLPVRTRPAAAQRHTGEFKKAPVFDIRGRFIGIAENGQLPGNCRAGIYVFNSGGEKKEIQDSRLKIQD
jgi:hypothetical protein